MSVLVLKNCQINNRLIPGSILTCLIQQKIGSQLSFTFTEYLSSQNSIRRYDIKAPGVFKVRQVGKTLVNR